jgi:hypothetical protein
MLLHLFYFVVWTLFYFDLDLKNSIWNSLVNKQIKKRIAYLLTWQPTAYPDGLLSRAGAWAAPRGPLPPFFPPRTTPGGPAQRRCDEPARASSRALSWSLTGGARLSVVFLLPCSSWTPNRSTTDRPSRDFREILPEHGNLKL